MASLKAFDKVTPLRPFDSPASKGIVDGLRDMALGRLRAVVDTVLIQADDALFDFVDKTHSAFEQQQYFDAMREVRRGRHAVAKRFSAEIERAFDDYNAGVEDPHIDSVIATDLALMDEGQLDERLAAEQLAASIERRFGPSLATLDGLLHALRGVDRVSSLVNPVAPKYLADAFAAGLRQVDIETASRLVVFKLYERELLRQADHLYGEMAVSLRGAGYVPAQFPSPEPEPDASEVSEWLETATKRDAGARPGSFHGGELSGDDADVFETLQRLLSSYREVTGEAGAHRATDATATRPDGSAKQPLSFEAGGIALASIQQMDPSALLAAIEDPKRSLATELKTQILGAAERLGVGSAGDGIGFEEQTSIDLVAMLFEVLLGDDRFHDRIEGILARLIVPYARVAMSDRHLLTQQGHPARRLLNALSEACEGNRLESSLEEELFDHVEETVERLVAEFNEDLEIFRLLESEFRAFLDQHRRRAEIAERRAAEMQRGRERLEQARAMASMEVAMLMGARDAPRAVDDFLRRYWVHHLTVTSLREGDNLDRFQTARAAGEQIWRAMLDAERGEQPSAALGDATRRILASSGVVDQAADEIVEKLRVAFAELAAGSGDALAALILPEQEISAAMFDEPATAIQVPSLDPSMVDAPLAAENSDAGLSLAGGTATLETSFDPADADRIRSLVVGSWVEFYDPDGTAQPAKLSWVSPISSRLLFVNRRGLRVCAASAEELAVMMHDGKLGLREVDTAFERAMDQVLGKMRRAVDGSDTASPAAPAG